VLLAILVATIDFLTAAGPVVNAIILTVVPLVLMAGAVYAMVLRSSRPEIFARIGGGERAESEGEGEQGGGEQVVGERGGGEQVETR
jgi:hypothetical protein